MYNIFMCIYIFYRKREQLIFITEKTSQFPNDFFVIANYAVFLREQIKCYRLFDKKISLKQRIQIIILEKQGCIFS